MSASTPPLFDAAQAQWMQGPLSILVGTCGPMRRPHVARAVGCCVGRDGASLAVLLQASTAEGTLDDLRTDGRIAVVFSDPFDHRSLQVKGGGVHIEPAGAGGAELAQLWIRSFARRLAGGVPAHWTPQAMADTFLTRVPGDLVSVRFVPDTIFDQTPGPAAGAALARSAA
ncbi:pyridoxamine 5'-phosphate oxidase family protein [Ramlibacter sp. AN1015]|uniref:pyridoxamine 5'-phosphate oxidase family protein n=1 Tax=Ramlibacter sp. AN1015 TaxID=3133428 RepID=UPI0030C1D53C